MIDDHRNAAIGNAFGKRLAMLFASLQRDRRQPILYTRFLEEDRDLSGVGR